MTRILLLTGVVCTGDAFADQIADVRALEDAPIHLSTGGKTIAELAASIPDMGPEPFIVIGFSMGGIIAMELLRQRPQDIAGACLVATNHDVPAESRKHGDFPVLDGDAFAADIDKMARTWFGPDVTEAELSRMHRMAKEIGPQGYAEQMRSLAGPRVDYTDTLATFSAPTLVIAPTHDPLCSLSGHQTMVRTLPNGTLLEVPGYHMCLWQQRAAVSAAIGTFLKQFPGHH